MGLNVFEMQSWKKGKKERKVKARLKNKLDMIE